MRAKANKKTRGDAGAALLIAIFALLLVSVVGIALVVSTSTDTALAGNYRMATGASYAGKAGLEEARGRLLSKNGGSSYLGSSSLYPTLFSPQGTSFALGDVLYIINQLPGETVDPTSPGNRYYDAEFANEFPPPVTANFKGFAPSVTQGQTASGGQAFPGFPNFKWVRINAVTELSLNLSVDGSAQDNTLLTYNGSGLIRPSVSQTPGPQALELTAFVVMPDNSTKLVQYVVGPIPGISSLAPPSTPLNQIFQSSLTLIGNNVTYQGPSSSSFALNGADVSGSSRTCSSTPISQAGYAVGFTNVSDQSNILSGIPSGDGKYYEGAAPYPGIPTPPPATAPTTPSIGQVGQTGTGLPGSLPASLQTPAQVESLIQNITQSADVVLTPTPSPPRRATVTGSDLTMAGANLGNPMTIVVNGDLDLTSWHNTGYGLLLVTGNLNYDPDASWNGVIMVLGQGTITGSKMGSGKFDGAIVVAQSRDSSGNVLANFGPSSVNFNSNMGGNGVQFDSCAIQSAFSPPITYKVLSFRELSQ